ncbi:transporter substrate-binding domain-containing protein [Sulfurimonas sp. MAG313]|nr:transporter substrate-binding domain-containing protein [Sulfurimonas sp. MAG313]MDF1882202.1 transporter substrate-binding domain-containing protein [Sulfurimonas sp. MAG313]
MKILVIIFFISLGLLADKVTLSMGENSVIQNISKDVLQRAYKRAGLEVDFKVMSFSDALISSNSGHTDGEVSRVEKIVQSYPNLIKVPIAINYIEAAAFSKDKTMKIKNWNDLKAYKIGLVKGVKFIEKKTHGFDKLVAASYNEVFSLLDKDKIDIVVVPKLIGIYKIFKHNHQHIDVINSSLMRLDLYHFVHKKNAYLIDKLVPVLEKMKESGEIKYIRSAYLRKISN